MPTRNEAGLESLPLQGTPAQQGKAGPRHGAVRGAALVAWRWGTSLLLERVHWIQGPGTPAVLEARWHGGQRWYRVHGSHSYSSCVYHTQSLHYVVQGHWKVWDPVMTSSEQTTLMIETCKAAVQKVLTNSQVDRTL